MEDIEIALVEDNALFTAANLRMFYRMFKIQGLARISADVIEVLIQVHNFLHFNYKHQYQKVAKDQTVNHSPTANALQPFLCTPYNYIHAYHY